jgi:signal transduction histidine kinase
MQTVPEILGNESELSQVFTNLLVNACHACEQDGVIIVETRADQDYLYASVTDNGSGISPEKIEEIFNPFFTTKPVGVGTGLGLAVSKDIIERHEGEIFVESEIGSGSTFTLKLPFNRTAVENED